MIIPTLSDLQYFVLKTRDQTVRDIFTPPVPGEPTRSWALQARAEYEHWLTAFVLQRTGVDLTTRMEVRDLPTARWGVSEDQGRPFRIVVSCAFADDRAADTLRAALATGEAGHLLGMGADAVISGSGRWRPGTGAPSVFGSDRFLLESIHSTQAQEGPPGGRDTNIVIFDAGLDPRVLGAHRAPTIGPVSGGWAAKVQGSVSTLTQPWTASAATVGHGTMVAGAAVKVAGLAKLWDVPILPPAVGDLQQFLSDAHMAYLKVLFWIDLFRRRGSTSDRWVLVNAWGVYDRRSEQPRGSYTENSRPGGHPFNWVVRLADFCGIDVLFAAGNSGPFFPHWRSGPHDWGPGRGIWGANGHKRVLCVGAVRMDHIWRGYSSHGPGPNDKADTGMLVQDKPDVCAPTDFADSRSAAVRYTGTSGACGVAAGLVASLRGAHPPKGLNARTPARLRAELRNTASLGSSVYDPALGFGVVDADRARIALA